MSKYDPLMQFLSLSRAATIPMRFKDIEAILGFALPASSRAYRAWWSNNPSNNVMTKAWLAAGFETEQVDLEEGRLVFRRTAGESPASVQPSASAEGEKKERRNPLFGWMKGTFTIAPGTDLTAPADPEWGDLAWGPDAEDDKGKNAA